MSDGYISTGRMFGPSSTVAALDLSLRMAKDWAEGERQREAEARQDAYEDDYADALRERIRATWEVQANVEALLKVLDTTNNPLKRIVNEVSVLYTQRPARRLTSTAATKNYREILKQAGDGVVMPRLNRLTNLHNTTLLYVRPAYDSLALKVIKPQDVERVIPDPDDATMPLFVEFRQCDPASNEKTTYHQWDRRPGSAGYRKYDEKGALVQKLPNPYFEGAKSPRQIIPILAVHREARETFWDQTSGDDLYELTIMVGMWETFINHLLRTDSTRQKWASGQIDPAGGANEGGTEGVIQLRSPDGGTVNVGEFSSQADWNGIGNQVKRKYDNALYNYGLVAQDTRTSGDPTSGFALKIRSQGLYKIQQAQVPSYLRSEETLYRVVSSVWNFERNNSAFPEIEGEALPPLREAGLEVEYAPVESEMTVEEREVEQRMDEKDIELGLSSSVRIYVRRNPETTDEEARAAIEKNKADTGALKPKAPEPMNHPGGVIPPPPAGHGSQELSDEEQDAEADA